MRRELIVFLVILAVVLIVGLGGRSLILNFAVNQIKGMFPGYDVSIGSADIRNTDMLAISDIVVKKDDAIRYRIKSVEINFSPFSLFTKVIPKVAVKDARLKFNSPDKNLKDLIEYPVAKPGKGFIARSVVISNLMVSVDTADWQLSAGVNGNITAGKEMTYKAEIELGYFDLAFLAKGLNVAEKVELSGRLKGSLSLGGQNLKVTYIKGDFVIYPDPSNVEGKLVIKDGEFLKKLAENTKQPLSVIEEGFKNYNFTRGTLRISRDAESILFHILLDGAKGERDLTVALHGF
ncbi:MAG: hypothetical protein A2879_05030 [Omnitrophica WOR_2 bacterium RIFCSPHIGHO2_01_FULL_49_10]|nr:MAG: hypothetical protein A2879_05030 [Omnitrophica WOR_2 bacterium RIFCSPHIGHO2_01_FULL_49_10]